MEVKNSSGKKFLGIKKTGANFSQQLYTLIITTYIGT